MTWAVVSSWVATVQNYLIVAAISCAVGLFGGYKINEWRHSAEKAKSVAVVAKVETGVANQNIKVADITNEANGHVAEQTTKRDKDEQVRIAFKDRYITVHDNAECMLDYGTVLLLNSSISGDVSSLSSPSEQSRSQEPSGVTTDQALDTLRADLKICHQALDQYQDLWDFNVKQKASSDAYAAQRAKDSK